MRKGVALILALLSLFTMAGCSSHKTEDIKKEMFEMSIDEIWEIDNTINFVVEMSGYLGRKSDYGKNINKLSEPERVIYITQELEMEVNNGGFAQYLYNQGGDFVNELVQAYTELGAPKTAEICKTAMDALGEKLPTGRGEWEEFLDNLDDEVYGILSECDDAFYEYEENLTSLSYDYILKNKENFS